MISKLKNYLLEDGLPCHRYILRSPKMTSPIDAATFAKSFVNTLNSADVSYEEIERVLLLQSVKIPPSSLIAGFDFASIGKMNPFFAFVDAIRMNDDIPTYPRCDAYYKTVDKQCLACAVCPLSPTYKNHLAHTEQLVLAYALSSPEAFSLVQSFQITATHFQSMIDIHASFMMMTKASCYPLLAETYSALCDPAIREDFFGRSKKGAFGNALSEYHQKLLHSKYTPKKRLTVENIKTLVDILADEIFSVAPPAKEEVPLLINALINVGEESSSFSEGKKSIQKGTQIADASNMAAARIEDFYEPNSSFPNPKINKKRKKKATDQIKVDVDVTPQAETVDFVSEITLEDIPEPEVPPFDSLLAESMIRIPLLSEQELAHFALCLDKENYRMLCMLEYHVSKEKRLCIEVIQTEKDALYLLLFSPKLHSYFYTNLTVALVYQTIAPLLTSKQIQKFCYYPFPTIASLKNIGIHAQNVCSLFSMSAILFGDHIIAPEQMLPYLGAKEAIGGKTIKPEGVIEGLPLKYMHAYPNVYFRNLQRIKERGFLPEYEQRNQLDVILSFSYYIQFYSRNPGVSFAVKSANNYEFHPLSNGLESGKHVVCRFHSPFPKTVRIPQEFICFLDDAGRFKKYPIFITGITNDTFSFYIEQKNLRRFLTLLNTSLVAFLRTKDLSGMTFHIEEY